MQTLIGNTVSDARLQKVVSLAQKLFILQPRDHATALLAEKNVNKGDSNVEFGADLVFREPTRFMVDVSLENSDLLGKDINAPTFYDRQHVHDDSINFDLSNERGKLNLSWLRDACDEITKKSTSQLSLDELAMAICRVLDSEKPGEEVVTIYDIYILNMFIIKLAYIRTLSLFHSEDSCRSNGSCW